MVVQELIALLGARLDPASWNQASNEIHSRMFRLRTALSGVVGGFLVYQAKEWAENAARFRDARAVMEANGQSLDDLRAKTGNLFDAMTLVTNYNKAKQFGLEGIFVTLTKTADAAAKLSGQSQDFMLTSLINAAGRQSPLLLDNLFILMNKKQLFDKEAAKLGTTPKSMTPEHKTSAVLAHIMKEGDKLASLVAEAVAKTGETSGDSYDQMHTASKDMELAVGQLADILYQKVIPALRDLSVWMLKVAESQEAKTFMKDLAAVAKVLWQTFKPLLTAGVALLGWFARLPGAAYLLTAALGLLASRGLMNVLLALTKVRSASGLLTGSLGGLGKAWEAAGLSATTFGGKLRFMLRSFGPIAAAAALAIAAFELMSIALEEVFAFLDDDKLGFFEAFAGRWTELSKALSADPKDSGIVALLKWVARGVIEVVSAIDKLMAATGRLADWTFNDQSESGDKVDPSKMNVWERKGQASRTGARNAEVAAGAASAVWGASSTAASLAAPTGGLALFEGLAVLGKMLGASMATEVNIKIDSNTPVDSKMVEDAARRALDERNRRALQGLQTQKATP